MIHLVIREPIEYQRTLCQALSDSFKGAFVAWFGETPDPPVLKPTENFSQRFLQDVGYLRLFRELKADSEAVLILGAWSSAMAYKTLLITTLLRVPIFVWTDHPHPRKRNWAFARLRQAYLRLLSHRVSGFLTCGQPTADHLESCGIDAKKIANFPYWVEVPNEWSLPRRCEAAQDEQPLRLIAVGRHVPVKAFEVAIEAVALANRKAGRNIATLDLIGDGKERPRLEALVRSLGLLNVVTSSGWLNNEEVWRRLRETDAVIVPSRFEPYGVVVLEALANGRPVLASDGVIAALDRDDGLGAIFFHAAGDRECLAQQIKILAEDQNVLRISSEAARAIAEKWRPERAASILRPILDKANHRKASDRPKQVEGGYDALSDH
jgi:glycosyltransferase involved in cell wall biosynthesis